MKYFLIEFKKRWCRIFEKNNLRKTNPKARLCDREWSTDTNLWACSSMLDYQDESWYARPKIPSFRECPQPTSWDVCICMPCTAPISHWWVADAHTCTNSAKYGPHCTMPPVPPMPPQSITNPCNYFGAYEPYKLCELASAKLMRPMAIGHPITFFT